MRLCVHVYVHTHLHHTSDLKIKLNTGRAAQCGGEGEHVCCRIAAVVQKKLSCKMVTIDKIT